MFSLFPPLLPSPVARVGRSCLLVTSLALALGAASVQAQSPASAGPGRVRMNGSFREVAPAGKTTTAVRAENVRDTLTAAEASAPMRIRLALRMRNADELQRRVAAGEIISREEMAARFLPDARDHQAVAGWLAAQGLTVTPAGAAHAVVLASGTPTLLEKAFETHFARVQFHGEEHTSATVAPSLPAEIQARVSNVHGLQPHLHPHNFLLPAKDILLYGEYPHYVNEITHAYNVTPSGLTGAGQTIGIIIDIPPLSGDLNAFYTNNALPQTSANFSVVDVDNNAPFDYTITDPNEPPAIEATLDTEWSSGIAVGAQVVVYAAGSLDAVNDAYSRVLDDLQSGAQPNLHQISMSYGAAELDGETDADIESVHNLFAAISAYGVTLFASSGDSGSYGNDAFVSATQVNYPASDPLVTGVGGTSLYLTDAVTVNLQSIEAETGWSFNTTPENATGGGYSFYFPLPSYQANVELADNFGFGEGPGGFGDGPARQVPDVAFVGDPSTGAYLYFRSAPTAVGGTSWSSPCWAGLCALINQGRAARKHLPLTTFNSAIYPLNGIKINGVTAFRDITFDNTAPTDGFDEGNGDYFPMVGYDLLTGLGVPNFTTLYGQLVTLNQEPFYNGQVALGDDVYFLRFPNGNYFGYYSYLSNPDYIYHYDLGYEYVFNAEDGVGGVYLYDFKSGSFFYTSPVFPFPYLYDFTLNTVLYYFPDPKNPGHYNTNGVRYFYDFATGETISL